MLEFNVLAVVIFKSRGFPPKFNIKNNFEILFCKISVLHWPEFAIYGF